MTTTNLRELRPFSGSQPPAHWGKLPTLVALVLLFVSIFSANFSLIEANDEKISIVDEWSYVDYIFRAAEGDIVRPGSPIAEDSLDYLACHEVIGVGPIGSGCGDEQKSDDYPLDAVSPAEIHPPIYFVITAQIARVVDAILPQFELIDSARMVGSLWLFAGLVIWLIAFKQLGVRLLVGLSAVVLVAFSPLVLSVTNFITPDATFTISSGLVFLATILWLKRGISYWWLLAAGLVPVLFKVTHLLSAFCAVLLIIALGLFMKQKSLKQTTLASAMLLSGTVLGLVGWQAVRSLIRVAPSPSHPNEPWALSILSFIRELGYHISTLPQFPGSVLPIPPGTGLIVVFFGWLLIAASIGGILYLRFGTELWVISVVSTATVFFGAALLSLITVVLSGGFLIPEARYGLPFLFLWVLPLTLAVREKYQVIGFAALAFAAWIAVFF
ncbi:MAG: hypothetical protein E6Q27_08825 [Aeromicrobium sp.]|nr:MAG: hypothetical protein E6Q27_08825 [Aeromicrobium sp.]